MINPNSTAHLAIKFLNRYNDPSPIYQSGKLDALIRFTLQQPAKKLGPHISEEFRDKFIRGPDLYGIDLAAMIIQMGRDHGVNGSFSKFNSA